MRLLNPQAYRGTLQSVLGLCGEMKRDRLGTVVLKKPEFIHSSFIFFVLFFFSAYNRGIKRSSSMWAERGKKCQNLSPKRQRTHSWSKMCVLVPFDCYAAIPKVQTLPCNRSPSLYWPDSSTARLRLCLEERFTDNQRWWSAANTHTKKTFKNNLKRFRSSQHRYSLLICCFTHSNGHHTAAVWNHPSLSPYNFTTNTWKVSTGNKNVSGSNTSHFERWHG